ncbi:MAG: hypothetical protein IPP26_12595 [Flavobacteriales bacterium]|nr:hypothetical protein [Flavobacteriales bacterium]
MALSEALPLGRKPASSIFNPLSTISRKEDEIYTHVSTKAIGKIRSPLDDLDL